MPLTISYYQDVPPPPPLDVDVANAEVVAE
jgi:hypothetical protein